MHGVSLRDLRTVCQNKLQSVNQIEEREEEDPHKIDDVPVQTDKIDRRVVVAVVAIVVVFILLVVVVEVLSFFVFQTEV